jgi:V/A-type H+/Na+-transporting ATPase subunit A
VHPEFSANRERTMRILQDESRLEEIVRLVGMESLSPREQLTLEVAKMIREDFLFQNAFDPKDAYTSPMKQFRILKAILHFQDKALELVDMEDFPMNKLRSLPVKDGIAKAHFIEESNLTEFDTLEKHIDEQISSLRSA